ncbi:MAG TPA: gluconokinase [Acetobacteraceae bacterium]|jgi:gluconokinase|nr:gluconokinase [Acetobacteraceae bacterium]
MACVVVVMGVSGSGKTTIARGVADRLGWDMLEGDAFHPPSNVEKMSHGIPLDDADRMPWLRAIAQAIDTALAASRCTVVACSALKRSYRDILIGPRKNVALVYLQGSRALLEERMRRRAGHFMPPSLLDSQLATLEEPTPDEAPITVSVAPPPERIVDAVIEALRGRALVP